MTIRTQKDGASFDKHWDLAENDQELNFTELEFAILRISSAFHTAD